MRKIALVLTMAAAGVLTGQPAPDDADALKRSLVALEKQSWVAWKNRDGKFFEGFLSDDHVEIGFGGVSDKKAVVAGVGSPVCVVRTYSVDRFDLKVLGPDTALLTYFADQDTTCGGNPVPSPVWVGSLYVRRGGKWWNAVYQQTQTKRKAESRP
ncbi:MAG TPA: nuclear transport factor 2 family protein [Thermoanaerobaculia bacterium]|jgi:hypothetical protein